MPLFASGSAYVPGVSIPPTPASQDTGTQALRGAGLLLVLLVLVAFWASAKR